MLEFFGFETGAFSQLTQSYMSQTFNPKTPDREGISYYSYGATVNPRFWSIFNAIAFYLDIADMLAKEGH
ncbi:unnamed protein product [Aureobasidium pullulans]|nr:unnamed protein product [Aureobasidium pullulans]